MQAILKLIRRFAAYGSEAYPGDAQNSWHAISNQIWLWNILLTTAVIPLIIVLIILFGDLVGPRRLSYLINYSAIPCGILLFQGGLFLWGNKGSLRRRDLALHLLIASDCAMLWLFSLCVGPA